MRIYPDTELTKLLNRKEDSPVKMRFYNQFTTSRTKLTSTLSREEQMQLDKMDFADADHSHARKMRAKKRKNIMGIFKILGWNFKEIKITELLPQDLHLCLWKNLYTVIQKVRNRIHNKQPILLLSRSNFKNRIS